MHKYKHTHTSLDIISLTKKSLRPDLQFGQWSGCFRRCDPFWILRSVHSTLMHQAKQRPTDIKTMCDKMSQTTNMTSPSSKNLWTTHHPHPISLFCLHPPTGVVGFVFLFNLK